MQIDQVLNPESTSSKSLCLSFKNLGFLLSKYRIIMAMPPPNPQGCCGGLNETIYRKHLEQSEQELKKYASYLLLPPFPVRYLLESCLLQRFFYIQGTNLGLLFSEKQWVEENRALWLKHSKPDLWVPQISNNICVFPSALIVSSTSISRDQEVRGRGRKPLVSPSSLLYIASLFLPSTTVTWHCVVFSCDGENPTF